MQTGNNLQYVGLIVKQFVVSAKKMCTDVFDIYYLIVFKLIKLICELLHIFFPFCKWLK